MSDRLKILLVYLAVCSAVTVVVTVVDKVNAKKKKSRVPEATLLLLGILGGSAAELLAMLLINHKTRHLKFMIGLPAILLVQCGVILWVRQKGVFAG